MHAMPILTIESAERLLKALEEYLENSEATFALILDRGGSILSQQGEIPPATDPVIFAALAAGSFAATHELALRIGETEFSALHQQGKRWHVLMTAINDNTMLVTVFGLKTTLGLVRFYSATAVKRIVGILDHAVNEPRIPIDLGSEATDASHEVFVESFRRA
jgi:predicted regulator of Ras-like GTPase activity (Roadblock/LC7/MglB family)